MPSGWSAASGRRLRSSARASPEAGPNIVAGTTVLADLVRQVGTGRVASVTSMVPAGVEVKDYEPTRPTCAR